MAQEFEPSTRGLPRHGAPLEDDGVRDDHPAHGQVHPGQGADVGEMGQLDPPGGQHEQQQGVTQEAQGAVESQDCGEVNAVTFPRVAGRVGRVLDVCVLAQRGHGRGKEERNLVVNVSSLSFPSPFLYTSSSSTMSSFSSSVSSSSFSSFSSFLYTSSSSSFSSSSSSSFLLRLPFLFLLLLLFLLLFLLLLSFFLSVFLSFCLSVCLSLSSFLSFFLSPSPSS